MPTSSPATSTIAAVIVVPMPAREGSARASWWILRGAAGEVAVEGLGRCLRGDLARLGAAHAVGDDEDRRTNEERVLVLAALAAGVGAEGLVLDPEHSRLSLPTD